MKLHEVHFAVMFSEAEAKAEAEANPIVNEVAAK